jgi:hypothetical protein
MSVFLPRKIKFISEYFKLVTRRDVVVRPITIGKGVGGVVLKSEGRRAEWTI